MWDLPGPGMEPVSPALAGGLLLLLLFFTTKPRGKPCPSLFKKWQWQWMTHVSQIDLGVEGLQGEETVWAEALR